MWDNHQALKAIANLLFTAAFLMLLYAAGFWLAHSPYVPVKKIRIDGELNHVTAEQLRAIAENELKGTFFTLNLDATRAAFEKLPWVRRAAVRRQWPDQLDIWIEEHVAVARWDETGLLSSKGEWFDAATSDVLPLAHGPKGSEKQLAEGLIKFTEILARADLKPVEFRLEARQAWELVLENGMVLKLGRVDVEPRLQRFVGQWKRHLATLPYRIEYIDLRYPNGFAVKMPDYKPGVNKMPSRLTAPAA